jgi:hypothetical protein
MMRFFLPPGRRHLHTRTQQFNKSLEDHLFTTLGSIVACEIVSIYGTYSLLTALHINVGPSFAMAFALNRGVRRIKTPVDVFFAAALSRAFPALTEINLARALDELPKWLPQPSPSTMSQLRVFVNTYGASYFVAARFTGVLSTSCIYVALLYGADVEAWMQYLGLSAKTGEVLGTWAAAVVGSAALFPLTSYFGAVVLAPRAYRVIDGLVPKK